MKIECKKYLAAAAFSTWLIFTAFFGAYAGSDAREPDPPIPQASAEPVGSHEKSNPIPELNSRGTVTDPLVVKVIPIAKSTRELDQDKRDRNEEAIRENTNVFYNRLTSIFTGLLIVVGTCQAALFVWQLKLVRSSIDVANIGAKASQEQVAVAQDAMLQDHRPWIRTTVIPLSDFEYSSIGATSTFRIKIKNVGRSPALNVLMRSELVLVTNDDRPLEIIEKLILQEGPGIKQIGSVLFPDEETFADIDFSVSASAIADGGFGRSSGNKPGFPFRPGSPTAMLPCVCGIVSYTSSIGKSSHITPFALEVQKRNQLTEAIVTLEKSGPDVYCEAIVLIPDLTISNMIR